MLSTPSSDWNTASVHQKQPPAKMAVSRVMTSILVGGEWNILKIGCAASYSKGGGAPISAGCSGRPTIRAAAMVPAPRSVSAKPALPIVGSACCVCEFARTWGLPICDACERMEHGFGAPEAASGENGGFTGHGVDPCRGRMEYPQNRMRRLLFQGRRCVDQRRVQRPAEHPRRSDGRGFGFERGDAVAPRGVGARLEQRPALALAEPRHERKRTRLNSSN